MKANVYSRTEKRDKKKARNISITIHALLALLFLIPFLAHEPTKEIIAEHVIEFNFQDFNSSNAKSTKAQATLEKAKPKKVTEKAAPKVQDIKPLPKPEAKPILVTPEPQEIEIPEIEEIPEEVVETPEPVEEVVPDPVVIEEAPAEEAAEEAPVKTEEVGDGDKNVKITDKGNGAGDSDEDVVDGKGQEVLQFPGDGIFNRKVIFRADVKKMTKENGKIVVNVCINKNGRVVHAEWSPEDSSIKDAKQGHEAVLYALKYKFARDYTAPNKQCGKLAFIFDLSNI